MPSVKFLCIYTTVTGRIRSAADKLGFEHEQRRIREANCTAPINRKTEHAIVYFDIMR